MKDLYRDGKYWGHDTMNRIYAQRPSRRWRFQHWVMELTDTRGFWTLVAVVMVAAVSFAFLVNL